MPSAKPRVFVSHSHMDDTFTERLVDDLNHAGASAWMDSRDLGAGDFQERISEALGDCEWFLLALSPDALASPWVRQEVDAANRLKHQGRIRDLIFIQARPVEHRTIPALWGVFNIFDATADYAAALSRTLRSLGLVASSPLAAPSVVAPPSAIPPERFPVRLATLGYGAHARDGVEWITPPLCLVPAGQFRLGSDKARDSQAYDNELNRRVVDLPAFEIARFPVTVAEYACFLTATQRVKLGNWNTQLQRLEHPVVTVSWFDAFDYAVWLANVTQQPWRLPTEAEWEKAARLDPRDPAGPLGASSERIYPWGDTFDATRCNTSESKIGTITPVGWYGPNDPDPRSGRQSGASPCGAEEMSGNVWEWTASERAQDYINSDIAAARDSTVYRALRGGAWGGSPHLARAAYRSGFRPGNVDGSIGFRLLRAGGPLAHST